MLPTIRRNLDLIIASTILVSSTLIAIYAYASATESKKPLTTFLSHITEGTSDLVIMNGNKCPGEIHTRFIVEGSYGLKSTGVFRTSYGSDMEDANFTAEAFFNPLNQFTRGEVHISTAKFSIEVKATNPNPIRVEITSQGSLSYAGSFSIPGPILIEKSGEKSYRINYPELPISDSPMITPMFQTFGNMLELSLLPSDETTKICSAKSVDRFNLIPVITKFGALAGPLSHFTKEQSIN